MCSYSHNTEKNARKAQELIATPPKNMISDSVIPTHIQQIVCVRFRTGINWFETYRILASEFVRQLVAFSSVVTSQNAPTATPLRHRRRPIDWGVSRCNAFEAGVNSAYRDRTMRTGVVEGAVPVTAYEYMQLSVSYETASWTRLKFKVVRTRARMLGGRLM